MPDEALQEQYRDVGRDDSGPAVAQQSAVNVVMPNYGTR